MCKFENVDAPGFELVADGIMRYTEEAPGRITRRWEDEKRELGLRRDANISDLSQLDPCMAIR